MSCTARLGAFALAVSSCLLPTAARAICNANNLASFQNCVATIAPGDNLVLGANIDLTGAGFGAVDADFTVVNGAFMLMGTGVIPKSGFGNVTLPGANGFIGAQLEATGGTISIGTPAALADMAIVLNNGASLVALANMTLTSNITLGPNGTSIVAAAPGRTLTLQTPVIGIFTANNRFQINDTVNNGRVILATLSGNFSATGIMTVRSGVLEGASALLPFITSTVTPTIVSPGAVLQFGTAGPVIRNLQGGGSVTAAGATLQVLTGDFAGAITANVLQKTGPGSLRLAGTSSPGSTQVVAGTLVLDGTLNSPVTVSSGTELRGSGTVNGIVSFSSGSLLAPGANLAGAFGTLTLQGVSLDGGQLVVDIPGPFAYDQVVAGTPVAGSGATLNLGTVGALPAGTVATILRNAGTVTPLPFTFAGRPEGSTLTGGGNTFRISYVGGDGNDVTLTVLAAPSAPTLVSATPGTGTATLVFTPNADGGSPILDYTATCGAAPPVTLATSPIVVTGLPNGIAASCTVTARNAIGTSPPSNALMVTPALPSFSGPSATGTGTITAILSGGGAGCTFAPTPAFIPVSGNPRSPPAGSAPAGVTFPHGLFDFTLTGCTPGSTISIAIAYPSALAPESSYWKYGPTPGNVTPHWYVLPAVLGGTTATITITDGGLGDDDLLANGTIVDQGGPGAGALRQVPALSAWMLVLLAALMAGGAVVARRR